MVYWSLVELTDMEPIHWSTRLPRGACGDAIAWCQTQPSYEQAWDACERADWLLWLASWLCDRKLVVLAACGCARTALKYVPEGEVRPRVAIETAEAWCRGEATIEQVRIAADAAAAADAASAAYADAAASTASTAAYAAYVAYAAANAANAAANAAAYADARSKALLDMATLVRSMIPRPELP
jgi:hypothetical protein